MAKEHTMQVIASGGLSAVVAARADAKTNKPAYEAKGSALAEHLINECKDQARGTWTRFYRDLLALESFGRAAFRKRISAEVKQGKADKSDIVGRSIQNSAKVRLSEFTAISKALDAGLSCEKDWAFHYAVGQARTFLASQASAGTKKRGRPAKAFLDKLKAFMEKNASTVEQIKQAEQFCHTYAQVKATAKTA